MPASSCTLPRQMFPPPTTIATETPARLTSAISSAIVRVVLTSTPPPSLLKASPEIFRRTRAYFAAPSSLPKSVSREAPDANFFAERANRTEDQLADADRIVFDEGLLEQAMLFEPFRELALDDAIADFGRLLGGHRRPELASQTLDFRRRHALAVEILRRHRGDVHRDIARELAELRIARDEVGLAVDLDEHADLSAGVDVAHDEPFLGDALGLLCSLRRAALEQQRLRAIHVAGRVEQRLPAVHHRSARLLAECLDLVGFGLV